MAQEFVRVGLKVERYRSQQGKPVCESNREEGEICIFLDDPTPDEDGAGFCRYYGVLQEVEGPDWEGQCAPCSECVLWSSKAEVVDGEGVEVDDDEV